VPLGRRTGRLAGVIGALAASAVAPSASPAQAIDSTWLVVDTVNRTAELSLVAGLTGVNGALNFNGFRDGGLVFTVPRGWRILIHFSNHDGMLPHSAVVVRDAPVPAAGPLEAAFRHAVTLKLQEGLTAGERDDMDFVADTAGAFRIVCGVPGHADAGMWIRLIVAPEARRPSLSPGGGP